MHQHFSPLFLSIPILNGNELYPFVIFLISVLLLTGLICYRRHRVRKLSIRFLEDKIKFIKLLQEGEKLRGGIKKLRNEIIEIEKGFKNVKK